MPQHRRLTYGDHPSQYVDILEPDEPAAALVHVIHGGFWREALSAELTAPIARDLCTDGFLVANIEYRRVGGGGGWPETFEDVKAAIAAVRQAEPDLVRSLAVGHSAGGHLSLLALAAGLADFAVALAPVSDVDRALRENLGGGSRQNSLESRGLHHVRFGRHRRSAISGTGGSMSSYMACVMSMSRSSTPSITCPPLEHQVPLSTTSSSPIWIISI